eukprot:jgi/Galph1/931/GphlegSOOS_G5706.1
MVRHLTSEWIDLRMCGIFGYVNFKTPKRRIEIINILLTGLKRLEYRGYDSAGIAYDSENDVTPVVVREVGTVSFLEKAVTRELESNQQSGQNTILESHVGIAHTRWATHGAPSVTNCHPHSSDSNHEFLVVHNGIITNYKPLKSMLQSKGYVFETETDTEVVAKLLKYLHDTIREDGEPPTFARLMMYVIHSIEGAFALLVKSTHYPSELVASKRGSPLVIGIKSETRFDSETFEVESSAPLLPDSDSRVCVQKELKKCLKQLKCNLFSSFSRPAEGLRFVLRKEEAQKTEFYFSSDPSAIVEHTNKVFYPEDNDVVHVKDGTMEVFCSSNEDPSISQNRILSTIDLELEQIMKGKFEHFMLKEIFEQPESIQQTMRGRIHKLSSGHFEAQLGGIRDRFNDILRSNRMIFVACGTSYHACLACRQIIEELTQLPVSVELASDFLDRQCPIFRSDVCIFVSQSGETAETLEALRYAKGHNALTVGVVNVVGSSIARMTDCGVHINAGCEIGVASTKVYTSQIVVLVMIALQLSSDSRSKMKRRQEIFEALMSLPTKVEATLKLDSQMHRIAKLLESRSSVLLFGRGYQYATCLEAALKIKEVSYMHTEGIHAGELKHGPLALVDQEMPVVLFATRDSTAKKIQNALQQVVARGGFRSMIVVCTENDEETIALKDKVELVVVPETVDCLQNLLNIIPFQVSHEYLLFSSYYLPLVKLLSYHLAIQKGIMSINHAILQSQSLSSR